jgi:hypothetical protein
MHIDGSILYTAAFISLRAVVDISTVSCSRLLVSACSRLSVSACLLQKDVVGVNSVRPGLGRVTHRYKYGTRVSTRKSNAKTF